jgi:hypothetical protein
MTAVPDQLAIAPADRDVEWLRVSFQHAIALEHSTIPLYLSAMLSLEVQNHSSYDAIRGVVMEEMAHLGIAANALAALGGEPRLRDLDPGYPTHGLPGGAEPDLHVGLACLSRPQLRHFLRLETPLFLLLDDYRKEGYPTIGALYAAIRETVIARADEVAVAVRAGGPANQVGADIGFTTIDRTGDAAAQLVAGIDEITEQGDGSGYGEGSGHGELGSGPRFQAEESHYARFAELLHGSRYAEPHPPTPLTRETEHLYFAGGRLGWPTVINTLAVPSDGYAAVLAADPGGPAVATRLARFDTAYSTVMARLDDAWNGPADAAWRTLGAAVGAMTSLRVLSRFGFMQARVPSDVVARLPELYPDEHGYLAVHTDLTRPVFYGPRFRNLN